MKGLEWLRRSAQSSYAPAQHLLATKTFADKRHRKTSMLWLENAANSKHQPAMLKLEKKAIRQAKRLKWSIPALHNRLTSFEQGVAWVDYDNH